MSIGITDRTPLESASRRALSSANTLTSMSLVAVSLGWWLGSKLRRVVDSGRRWETVEDGGCLQYTHAQPHTSAGHTKGVKHPLSCELTPKHNVRFEWLGGSGGFI